MIVIELDGSQHFEERNQEYDQKRTECFQRLGLKVIRFNNVDVLMNIDEIMQNIYSSIVEPENVIK
jgi:very-short-patch-repair endonuclease